MQKLEIVNKPINVTFEGVLEDPDICFHVTWGGGMVREWEIDEAVACVLSIFG